MTTLVDANEAIAQHFADAWGPTGFPFQLENEDFNTPNGTPWARFTQRIQDASQETLGPKTARKFQRDGSAFAQIFIPGDTGTSQSKQLAQTVVAAFEGERITGTTIRFLGAIPRETGQSGKWFQTNVEIIFQFHETK